MLPDIPLLVANTLGSIVAVLCVFVAAVVANVTVVDGFDSENADEVRKISAMQGAGSGTVQELEEIEQLMVVIEGVP